MNFRVSTEESWRSAATAAHDPWWDAARRGISGALGKIDLCLYIQDDGAKLQLLYVLRNTRLAELLPDPIELKTCHNNDRPRRYILLRDGMKFPQYTLQEYASLIRELAGLLPAETALYRVTGDPPKKDLILPKWTTDKKRVLNTIRAEFRKADG